MKSLLDAIRSLRCLVIGEAIRDVYHFVAPLGMSQKDAIVTWQATREEVYDGGATACANHLREFCANVGEITQPAPIVKARYVGPFTQKVFAVETAGSQAIVESARTRLLEAVALEAYDVVLVADYGHGLFTPDVISRITAAARFLAVMVQTNSSNFGFNLATKYQRADYICLDELELRLAMQDREGSLLPLANKLRDQLGARIVAVTQGHRGALIVDPFGVSTIGALSTEIVDRMGAGDAFFALTSPCAALGATRAQIGWIGNAAGAIAVRTMGNKEPVTRAALEAMLQ